ncbi:hypothetical protein RJT34_14623 [Clitoria ternatea]|uniref:Uncharacterized protein n=1 Tax=Clitoria ternatea TaxID=43366 RepID=A0AAN9PL92_CLITE
MEPPTTLKFKFYFPSTQNKNESVSKSSTYSNSENLFLLISYKFAFHSFHSTFWNPLFMCTKYPPPPLYVTQTFLSFGAKQKHIR